MIKHSSFCQSRKSLHERRKNSFAIEYALNQNVMYIKGSPLNKIEISPFYINQADTTHCIRVLKTNYSSKGLDSTYHWLHTVHPRLPGNCDHLCQLNCLYLPIRKGKHTYTFIFMTQSSFAIWSVANIEVRLPPFFTKWEFKGFTFLDGCISKGCLPGP